MKVKLESFLQEISEKTTENDQYPVLTSSKTGLYLQSDYFNKQVASKDNTGYKIIRRGQFTYRAMSDTGEFFPNMLECADIGIVSPAYPVFEITRPEIIIPEFLKYFFKSDSFQYSIASFAQGSTRTSVKFGKMKTVSINLPSIAEQRHIVEVLDRAQAVVAGREQERQKLDELVKARFIEMFEDGKYPQTTIAELVSGKVPSVKKDFLPDETIKYIDISSIDNKQNVMTGYTEYVVKEAPSRAQQHISKGDIVISTVRPNLRNVAITQYEDNNLVASSGFCVLRASKCLPEYLMAIVTSDKFTDDMTKVVTGANYPAIKDSDVMSYHVALPPMELQEQFAEFVKQVDKSKAVVKKALDEAQLLFDSLMQQYFG